MLLVVYIVVLVMRGQTNIKFLYGIAAKCDKIKVGNMDINLFMAPQWVMVFNAPFSMKSSIIEKMLTTIFSTECNSNNIRWFKYGRD